MGEHLCQGPSSFRILEKQRNRDSPLLLETDTISKTLTRLSLASQPSSTAVLTTTRILPIPDVCSERRETLGLTSPSKQERLAHPTRAFRLEIGGAKYLQELLPQEREKSRSVRTWPGKSRKQGTSTTKGTVFL